MPTIIDAIRDQLQFDRMLETIRNAAGLTNPDEASNDADITEYINVGGTEVSEEDVQQLENSVGHIGELTEIGPNGDKLFYKELELEDPNITPDTPTVVKNPPESLVEGAHARIVTDIKCNHMTDGVSNFALEEVEFMTTGLVTTEENNPIMTAEQLSHAIGNIIGQRDSEAESQPINVESVIEHLQEAYSFEPTPEPASLGNTAQELADAYDTQLQGGETPGIPTLRGLGS
ncbi:MAG: hypothetical protein ACRBDI_05115 [Alphaproteobacteria bacterium]